MDKLTIQQLFQNLNSRDAELRQEALRQARGLSSENLCQLLALFHRHAIQRSRHMLTLILSTTILLMCLSTWLALRTETKAAVLLFMVSIFLTWCIGFWPYRVRNSLLP